MQMYHIWICKAHWFYTLTTLCKNRGVKLDFCPGDVLQVKASPKIFTKNPEINKNTTSLEFNNKQQKREILFVVHFFKPVSNKPKKIQTQ